MHLKRARTRLLWRGLVAWLGLASQAVAARLREELAPSLLPGSAVCHAEYGEGSVVGVDQGLGQCTVQHKTGRVRVYPVEEWGALHRVVGQHLQERVAVGDARIAELERALEGAQEELSLHPSPSPSPSPNP